MQDTNFTLSDADVHLLADTSFFVQKRRLFERIRAGLQNLESALEVVFQGKSGVLPEELLKRRGKISQGENLLGLPWMLLDYPAYFSKADIFAFRTLFWWGNPLSITLHLSGRFVTSYGMNLLNHSDALDGQLLFCINSEQFIHHFDPSNYKTISSLRSESMDFKSQPLKHGFIKIARTLPIEEADKMIASFTAFCNEMTELMER